MKNTINVQSMCKWDTQPTKILDERHIRETHQNNKISDKILERNG